MVFFACQFILFTTSSYDSLHLQNLYSIVNVQKSKLNVIPEIDDPFCRTMAQTFSRSLSFTVVGQVDVSESDSRGKPNWSCVLKVFITPLRAVFEGVR